MTAWSLIAKPGVVSFRAGAGGRWAPDGRGVGGFPCAHKPFASTTRAMTHVLRIICAPVTGLGTKRRGPDSRTTLLTACWSWLLQGELPRLSSRRATATTDLVCG